MRDFVWGKGVVLQAFKVDGYYSFACARTVRLRMNTEPIETTVPGDGAWKSFASSNQNEYVIELNLITVLKDAVDALWFSWETLLEQIRSNAMDLKMTWTDRTGFTKYATFKGLIIETVIDGTAEDDFSYSSITLKGAGKFDITGLITTTGDKVRRKEWIATGAEPNVLQDNDLIGRTMKYVNWEANDKFSFISIGVPNPMQCLFDSSAGTLTFLNNLAPNDFVYCLYE